MSALAEVTDATLESEVLTAPGTTVVEFWAEWCGPCRAVGPVLEQLAAENHDGVRFVKMNADDNVESAAKYGVMSIPMLKVFQNGEVVKTIVGARPAPAFRADLAPFFLP